MSKIAIFDSGVGGLSIYFEVKAKLPCHDYVFISDNAAYPYGTKSEDWLLKRVTEVVDKLVEIHHPDMLVIACNTASTVTLPALRARFSFPIVGVVPAIKPAASLSKTKEIAVLATPATIQRAYTKQLISQFAQTCTVHCLGSIELVELAEKKMHGVPVDQKVLLQCLESLLNLEKLDVVVLACTHFPLLREEIAACFASHNKNPILVDSGEAIANRVDSLLVTEKGAPTAFYSCALFTDSISKNDFFVSYMKRVGFQNIDYLAVAEVKSN